MDNKKEKNEKQNGKKEKKNFFHQKSFFVVLVVGMVFIAAVAILNSFLPKEDRAASTFDSSAWESATKEAAGSDQAVKANADAVPVAASEAPASTAPKATKSPEATKAPVASASPKATAEAYEDETAQATTGDMEALETDHQGTPAMTKPVPGEVSKEFSGEELVFSTTMNDWRVHEGTDLKAAVGDEVKAVADGVVDEIYEDDLLGMTVVVSHTGGVKSLYANLKDSGDIKHGGQVKAGDVIGHVGESTVLEAAEEPHLHFEIIKDNRCVNPMEFVQ